MYPHLGRLWRERRHERPHTAPLRRMGTPGPLLYRPPHHVDACVIFTTFSDVFYEHVAPREWQLHRVAPGNMGLRYVMWLRHVFSHVFAHGFRHALRHVFTHVVRHGFRHMFRHACRHAFRQVSTTCSHERPGAVQQLRPHAWRQRVSRDGDEAAWLGHRSGPGTWAWGSACVQICG